jgi:hypothetical protein
VFVKLKKYKKPDKIWSDREKHLLHSLNLNMVAMGLGKPIPIPCGVTTAMPVPVVVLRLQRGNPEGDVVTHS